MTKATCFADKSDYDIVENFRILRDFYTAYVIIRIEICSALSVITSDDKRKMVVRRHT